MFGTYFLIKDDKVAIKRDIRGNKSLFSNVRNPDPHKKHMKKSGIAMAHPIPRNCFLSTNESNFLKIQCKLDSIDSIEKNSVPNNFPTGSGNLSLRTRQPMAWLATMILAGGSGERTWFFIWLRTPFAQAELIWWGEGHSLAKQVLTALSGIESAVS